MYSKGWNPNPIIHGTGGPISLGGFPYSLGQSKWARQQRRKVAAMRKAVRNDDARIAAAAAKRGRRMRRNQLGFGTGREA